jgi:hypothetical protein
MWVSHDSEPPSQSWLFETLYAELHQIAQRELRRSSGAGERGAFLAYASRVIRNLVIDLVRRHHAIKRGGGFEITSFRARWRSRG